MTVQPDIGKWYQIRSGDQFEVVAIDEDDRTIEVQYFDGTVEELDLSDWEAEHANGAIEQVDAPEDGRGSADFDDDDERVALSHHLDGAQMHGGLDGLDIFEAADSYRFQ